MAQNCGHDHSHAPANVSSRKLALAVGLTLVLVAAEAIAGAFAHSLALVSDAGHNFADAAALGFSWYAIWISAKPSNATMTFGYHRVGILAALGNALSLVIIAICIGYEAIVRLHAPQPVNSGVMSVTAGAAIVVNILISIWLHAGAKHDINIRGAYLHMVGDAISAVGVVVAGIIVAVTGATIADPIVSFLIAALILASSWGILKQSIHILLEGTPHGMDMDAVLRAIREVPGARDVHDLHVWTVGPSAIAASCHVLVDEQTIRDAQQILKLVADRLRHDFSITHTTVQIEVEGCETEDVYCTMTATPNAATPHV